MAANGRHQSGFSLIEVLVFVSILSVFFVVAVSVSVASLRNMQINSHKILATRYAEELVEWLRNERDNGWVEFSTHSSTGSGTTFCFNDNALSWPSAGNCASYNGIGTRVPINYFKREVKLTADQTPIPLHTQVDVVVSWQDFGNVYTVRNSTNFSIFEVTTP